MTWGILAYLASTPSARRWLSALSAVLSLSVGLTTVYLGTHWLSDVLLGWAAGLVLLALPWLEPTIATAEAWLFTQRDRLRARLRARRRGALPTPEPVLLTPVQVPAAEEEPAPLPGDRPADRRAPPGRRRCWPPGPHTARSERTPVTRRQPPPAAPRPPGPRHGGPGGASADRRLSA
ncbi:Phosphatase OS=Streptomyces glaucescens OX=1907 GN=SGLAU_07740 PE=4 SV=1 [Streptomyces glaucescens]